MNRAGAGRWPAIFAWLLPAGPDGLLIRRNVGWLVTDRVFRLVVALVINVWLIRYLGASQFGLLGFTQSLIGLFAILSQLGLESIVVRDLVRRPEQAGEVLGTSAGLRLGGAVLTLTFSVGAMGILRPADGTALALAWILGSVAIVQALDVIEHWFQSRSSFPPFVLARAAAFIVASVLKIACLLLEAPLAVIGAAIAAEFGLAAVGLTFAYQRSGGTWRGWRFRVDRARRLLADSWPLLLSSVAILLYTRTDQVMLTLMRGDHENGIYAAAQRLSEILYFIPAAVSAAANPALLRSHQRTRSEYESRLGRLLGALAWAAILIALPISLLSGWITVLLFGTPFRDSGPVLALHVWAAPAVFLGVAQSVWFIADGLQRGLLLRTVVGAVANVGLNLWLIPTFGARGAAVATLISQWVASVLLNAVISSTRPLFRLQMRAFFLVGQR